MTFSDAITRIKELLGKATKGRQSMNELDCMKRDKERILSNWKERLKEEKKLNQHKCHPIEIVVDTLEWFLWMIESREAKLARLEAAENGYGHHINPRTCQCIYCKAWRAAAGKDAK